MVLDRCPDNFFAETEQVAFCPSHVPPGIDFSNDPLLQGRLFSYLDTQLSRLGSANFHQLPINAPKCPFANHQRDGHMQMAVARGRTAYEPGGIDLKAPRESHALGFRSARVADAGDKGRIRPESFGDHYSQARQFYLSQLPIEQAHLASALVFELSKVESVAIRESMVGHLVHVDFDLSERVAKGLGLAKLPPAPTTVGRVKQLKKSAALGLIAKSKDTLEGRCVGILVSDGSNARAIDALKKAVLAEKATVKIIAPRVGPTKLSGAGSVQADGQLAGTPSVLFDAVAVILSDGAAALLANEGAAIDFVRDAFGHLKAIAADVGGRALLGAAGVHADAGVIDAFSVDRFIVAAKSRHWAREPNVRTLA